MAELKVGLLTSHCETVRTVTHGVTAVAELKGDLRSQADAEYLVTHGVTAVAELKAFIGLAF